MLDRARHSLTIAAISLAGGGGFAAGLRAYEAGRFDEALAVFRELELEAGNDASAELLYDQALAALGAGELAAAETAAEKAAVRGGAELEPRRDMLLGSAAFERSQRAARAALRPEGDPLALERALAHAEEAFGAWRRAAVRRPDWPAARRNAERALRELERLRAERAAAEERARETPEVDPEAQAVAEERPAELEVREGALEAQAPDVSERAAAVLELLSRKEREKRELRAARRAERSRSVERDW